MPKEISTSLFRAEQPEDLLALKPIRSKILLRRSFFDAVGETDLGDRAIGLINATTSLTLIHREGL